MVHKKPSQASTRTCSSVAWFLHTSIADDAKDWRCSIRCILLGRSHTCSHARCTARSRRSLSSLPMSHSANARVSNHPGTSFLSSSSLSETPSIVNNGFIDKTIISVDFHSTSEVPGNTKPALLEISFVDFFAEPAKFFVVVFPPKFKKTPLILLWEEQVAHLYINLLVLPRWPIEFNMEARGDGWMGNRGSGARPSGVVKGPYEQATFNWCICDNCKRSLPQITDVVGRPKDKEKKQTKIEHFFRAQ